VFERFNVEEFDHLPLLYTTAKNLFIDKWRKKKTRSFVVATEEQPEVPVLPAVAEASNIRHNPLIINK